MLPRRRALVQISASVIRHWFDGETADYAEPVIGRHSRDPLAPSGLRNYRPVPN